MALVSTFELLVKRIAPLTPSDPINAAFRRVVQGYFLTISNPNDQFLIIRVRATIPTWVGSPPSPNPQNARELINGPEGIRNHIYTYDITGGAARGQVIYSSLLGPSLPCGENAKRFQTGFLFLPPCQTAAVKILPDLESEAINLGNPSLEIRGYVEIFRTSFFPIPQEPVELVLTPEIRGTFLDNNYPDFCGGNSLDFDQIAYSLPLADGAARVKVESLPVSFPFDLFSTDIEQTKLETNRDYAGKIVLQDNTLKQFDEMIKREKEINPAFNFDLVSFREYVEAELNRNPELYMKGQ